MSDFTIMGVVNVTPDSFSDGGRYLDAEAAIEHGLELEAEGAAILDVGGESTRPGADPVPEAEELHRVIPVIEGLIARGGGARVSIDTSKAAVAARALEVGATLVNDVTAFRGDPEMAAVVAGAQADCCLMHMLGDPRTMQDDPHYEDVVGDIKAFLEERMSLAIDAGIAEERILLDPGIGFGKTVEHNLELLRRLDELVALGRPVVVGISRKSSLRRLVGDTDLRAASVAAAVAAYDRGASIVRAHDVREHVEALAVASAIA
ncbi:MAG TPA: dihydropteroate synthase [Gaiellaceae bacterium]|nr:dihydropteroate synthase [Gaiellaceae bacterium]